MINKELVKYSINNIIEKKTRSILTVISILIGITTIFIFISFGMGLYNYINSFATGTTADKIIIQPKGVMGAPGSDDTFSLSDKDLRAIERANGVIKAEGYYSNFAQIEYKDKIKYASLISQGPKETIAKEVAMIKIEKGRELENGDTNKVVLGYNYLIKNKIFSDALSLNDKIKINDNDYRIVGFYQKLGNPSDDSNIYILPETLKLLYPNIKGYSIIVARVDTQNVESVIGNVKRGLRSSRNVKEGREDFYIASFEDMINAYKNALNIVISFIILIALISIVVSAVNTANTMITSVLERTKEVGILKSIGAKNSEIFGIFLFESGFLGLVAGIIGVIFGAIFSFIAENILENFGWGFLHPSYSPYLFIGCILFATLTGAISGVIPAMNASRTNIVDSLKYE